MRGNRVHKSLMVKRTKMGVDQRLLGLNFTVSGVIIVMGKMFWYLPITIIKHLVFVQLTKKDPFMIAILFKYTKLKHVYEPFPLKSNRLKRPTGWGKDENF